MNKTLLALALAAAGLLSAASASAVPITVGGGWSTFSFGGTGSAWNTSFEFTLAGMAELRVTDAFQAGDRFDVLVNGSSVGLTSLPTAFGDQINSNFDGAYADSRWSSGHWLLGAGSYVVTGFAPVSPFGGGSAAVMLAPAIPEPETYALMAGGLALLALVVRRRRAD